MIYIIDNGQIYSSHALHFVEAPKDFGAWFDGVLLPWLQLHDLTGSSLKIMAVCPKITWREDGASDTYQEFLGDYLRIAEINDDVTPAEHRPLYRGA